MSLAKCMVMGCREQVRQGLVRRGKGANGADLADGETCWRCRQRLTRETAVERRRRQDREAARREQANDPEQGP